MHKKGYVKTYSEFISLDESAPTDVIDFANNIVEEYGSFDNYFSSSEQEMEDYGKYFCHSMKFGVTEKFVKRYGKKI